MSLVSLAAAIVGESARTRPAWEEARREAMTTTTLAVRLARRDMVERATTTLEVKVMDVHQPRKATAAATGQKKVTYLLF